MKAIASVTVLLVFALAGGCTKLDEGTEEARRRQPVAPGIAPFEGLEAGRASGAGNATGATQPPAQPAGERRGIIGKTTNEVVDLHAALAENPNLIVAEQRVQGGDPISFALDAYVDARSRIGQEALKYSVRLYQAANDRLPSYNEFMQMMRENRVELTMVYPYQKYAYDSQTGAIVVLEDPDDKRRRYEAAGIPVDE
ncbi:MAG TPA: hypothetical protein VML55_21990 [Planctomycetaceae bacterium]|nr:hypothetical protein [Planctomycetaceae bacterium]